MKRKQIESWVDLADIASREIFVRAVTIREKSDRLGAEVIKVKLELVTGQEGRFCHIIYGYTPSFFNCTSGPSPMGITIRKSWHDGRNKKKFFEEILSQWQGYAGDRFDWPAWMSVAPLVGYMWAADMPKKPEDELPFLMIHHLLALAEFRSEWQRLLYKPLEFFHPGFSKWSKKNVAIEKALNELVAHRLDALIKTLLRQYASMGMIPSIMWKTINY